MKTCSHENCGSETRTKKAAKCIDHYGKCAYPGCGANSLGTSMQDQKYCGSHARRLKEGNIHRPIATRTDRKWTVNGYTVHKVPGVPVIYEHREVMETMLGRKLYKGENVHHINGVKTDNRPENLELWVTAQPTGQRPQDLVVWAKMILERYEDTDFKE